jgi:hypothetical protein
MMLWVLLAGTGWGAEPELHGALADVGDALDGAVVTRVETHPEYERYWLRQADGRESVAEMVTGADGMCEVGDLTLFPRPELGASNGTVGLQALCARMAERSPHLRARRGEGSGEEPIRGLGGAPDGASGGATEEGSGPESEAVALPRSPGPRDVNAPVVPSVLHGALLLLVALAIGRARPDRMLLGVGAAALAARLLCAPMGIVNGNLAGYEKLVLARGTLAVPPYGEGWGALMGLVPGWPDSVFRVDLLLAVLAAPLLAALVRRAAGARAGLAAGLLFALLPTHVAVSASETMHVSVLTFELGAVLAADAVVRARRADARAFADALIAALATGLAVHIRPDALPFVAVLPGWMAVVWATRSRGAMGGDVPGEARGIVGPVLAGGIVLAALVGWRLATLGTAPSTGLVHLPGLHALLPELGPVGATARFQLFWHAGFTPPVLWGLAALGLAVLLRRGRALQAVGWLAWALIVTLPFVEKAWPGVDAVRLQLSGQAPWVALAGIGLAVLPRWALPMALVAMLPFLREPPWVQTEEWRFLHAVVPTLPEGATVRYDPRPQRAAAFAAVMEALGPARWSPTAGTYTWVGLDCRVAGDCDLAGCTPYRTTVLAGRVDADLTLSDRSVGLWKCGD